MSAQRLRAHVCLHVVALALAASVPHFASAQTVSLESLLDPEAKVVARLDVARVRAAPSYPQIAAVLTETMGDAGVDAAHAREVLARVDECVLSARTDDLEAEKVLLLARGRFTLDDTTRLSSSPGVTMTSRGNHRVMRRGEKAGVFVGNDRFVFGNADLVFAALDRIDGRAPRVPFQSATLARLLAEPSRTTPTLAVIGVVDGELAAQLASELGGVALARARAFSITMDLTSALAMTSTFEMPDEALATRSAAELSALLGEAGRMPAVRTMGLTTAVRGVRARATGLRLAITARLRDADVRRLMNILGTELGGAPPAATAVR